MQRSEYYLNPDTWNEIERGYVFDAALPYWPAKQPLSFFVPDEKFPGTGSINRVVGNFSPIRVKGQMQAVEQQIVVGIKPRKVIIVSDNFINQSKAFEYIMVLPLHRIQEEQRTREWYSQCKDDEHPFFIYYPKRSLERYVDTSQMISIHKNVLLKKAEKVPDARMELIEDNLITLLGLSSNENEQVQNDDSIVNK